MTQMHLAERPSPDVDGLLREYEIMHNVSLCSYALGAFAFGFSREARFAEADLTLWHMFSALPLVLYDTPRRAITKRRAASGLRSILNRDPSINLGQNEVILNLAAQMRDMRRRSLRAINCALAWNILTVNDGLFAVGEHFVYPKDAAGEVLAILRAADKLGRWAAQCSTFEYLTILGLDPSL